MRAAALLVPLAALDSLASRRLGADLSGGARAEDDDLREDRGGADGEAALGPNRTDPGTGAKETCSFLFRRNYKITHFHEKFANFQENFAMFHI